MNVWIAAADNRVDKVKEYLNTSQFTANSKDANGYTPLHAAAEYAHLELLKYLVDNGGDVNVADNDGDTPLHACERPVVAEMLIELGADPSIKNKEGLTPLQKAEEDEDFPELITFLRERSGSGSKQNHGQDELPYNVRLSMESPADLNNEEIPVQVTDEQRARLSEIVENGTDADLEEYLKNILGNAEEDSKRQKH